MNNFENRPIHLKRINFVVTGMCNLHCRMCDLPELNSRHTGMTLEEVKAVIKEAADLGVGMIELSGGEPMTRKDIYDIISYTASLGLDVHMSSNASLIGPGDVEKLLEAGLRKVAFSLEGPEPLNDWIRGRGSFQKTLSAIQGFLRYRSQVPGLILVIGVTLSRYNYQIILPFSKYLAEELDVDVVSINPFNRNHLTLENRESRRDEFNIPEGLIPDLTEQIEKLILYSKSVPGKLQKPGYLRRIPDYFMGKKLVPPGGCTMPSSFCGISAHGLVHPCWHGPAAGNLKEASLTEIVKSEAWQKSVDRALCGECGGCLSSCYYEMY